MTTVLLLAAALAALADWSAVAFDRPDRRPITKPLPMVLLIAATLWTPSIGSAHAWFVAGLALSLLGDVLLLGRSSRAFLGGLSAFLLAHVAFVIAFVVVGMDAAWAAAATVAVAVCIATVGRRVVAGAAAGDPAMRGPVIAYLVVISAMVVAAAGTRSPWLIGGALAFYVSDSLLGWNRFVRPARLMPLAVMVTYHGAQFAFVSYVTTR